LGKIQLGVTERDVKGPSRGLSPVLWPDGKKFAFTAFDDTDSQTLAAGSEVYALLRDLGFRTTKSVWPIRPTGTPSDHGATCDDPQYLAWAQELQRQGFEIGFHAATAHTSPRADTVRALEAFKQYFGHYPAAISNHYFSSEGVYLGDARLTGANRAVYNLLTRFRNRNRFRGHVEGDPLFWGDLCRDKIRYVRQFAFAEINTLKACPYMPYHDPARPYVNSWYASTEGPNCGRYVEALSEANQERLEAEGGACIMYVHFAHGFCENGRLDPRFRALMERLARRPGWFAPVTETLDCIQAQRGPLTLTAPERNALERRWLAHKIFYGVA
jgi:hypothetical protein